MRNKSHLHLVTRGGVKNRVEPLHLLVVRVSSLNCDLILFLEHWAWKMRRKVGIGGIKKKEASKNAYAALGKELEAEKSSSSFVSILMVSKLVLLPSLLLVSNMWCNL